MTRILFLPNPSMLVWVDLPIPVEEVEREVKAGAWFPPPPIDALIPPESALSVTLIGDTVVVQPVNRNSLSVNQPVYLSKRQREVLIGMTEGLTAKEIALRLGLAKRTVYFYMAQLKAVTGCLTRVDLVRRAVEMGLLSRQGQASRHSSYNPNRPPSPSE